MQGASQWIASKDRSPRKSPSLRLCSPLHWHWEQHALELPNKIGISCEHYFIVQRIYDG
jgi:hypothetical protein